jgi:ABC-type dipeptide/oligopeptide/nickel transport system permease subunit
VAVDASLIASAPAVAVRRGRVPPISVLLAGLILLAVLVLVAVGPLIAPHDPNLQSLLATLQTPSSAHWLGTDDLGRDIFSRVLAGTRSAMIGPLLVAVSCATIGGSLGLAAGFHGGVADQAVSRLVDIVYALPGLLVLIVFVGIVGGGYWLTVVILVGLSFPYQTRICRSATLAQSRLTYVDTARTIGFSARRIMFRHLLPNIFPTLLTAFLLDFVGALIAFSALDYLGLGVTPGSPDWGSMIAGGQSYITSNPWYSLAPAIALVLTASSATLLGDWGYDRLARRAAAE